MAMYGLILVVGILVVPIDPELVAERTQAKEGVKGWDKSITIVGSILYPLAILVVAGLDVRFEWSSELSIIAQIAALIVAASGYMFSAWAMSVNTFYSRFVCIQTDRGHVPISAGPYAWIRHPGYLGQIFFSLASAVALGSLWALIPGVLFSITLLVRTALEDQMLLVELTGYEKYAKDVRSRLIPGIW
jgi:protein-S-isoprenylcysteine O-methyltransferase Ste14